MAVVSRMLEIFTEASRELLMKGQSVIATWA
jgi:hypothetical protein